MAESRPTEKILAVLENHPSRIEDPELSDIYERVERHYDAYARAHHDRAEELELRLAEYYADLFQGVSYLEKRRPRSSYPL